jgi:hypothetical protein
LEDLWNVGNPEGENPIGACSWKWQNGNSRNRQMRISKSSSGKKNDPDDQDCINKLIGITGWELSHEAGHRQSRERCKKSEATCCVASSGTSRGESGWESVGGGAKCEEDGFFLLYAPMPSRSLLMYDFCQDPARGIRSDYHEERDCNTAIFLVHPIAHPMPITG